MASRYLVALESAAALVLVGASVPLAALTAVVATLLAVAAKLSVWQQLKLQLRPLDVVADEELLPAEAVVLLAVAVGEVAAGQLVPVAVEV